MIVKNIINILSALVFLAFLGLSFMIMANNDDVSVLGVSDEMEASQIIRSDERVIVTEEFGQSKFIRTYDEGYFLELYNSDYEVEIYPNTIVFIDDVNLNIVVIDGVVQVDDKIAEKYQRLFYVGGQWEQFEVNEEIIKNYSFIRKLGEKLWEANLVDEKLDFLVPRI